MADKHRPCAVVHDWLYARGYVDRKEADKIFLQHMDRVGVSMWKRYSMYYGVRAGGWVAWNKHREKELE